MDLGGIAAPSTQDRSLGTGRVGSSFLQHCLSCSILTLLPESLTPVPWQSNLAPPVPRVHTLQVFLVLQRR